MIVSCSFGFVGLAALMLVFAAAYASDGGKTSGFSSNLSNCRRGRSPRESGNLEILLRLMAKTLSAFSFPISSGSILIRFRLRSRISKVSSFRIFARHRQRPDLDKTINFKCSD